MIEETRKIHGNVGHLRSWITVPVIVTDKPNVWKGTGKIAPNLVRIKLIL